MNSPRILVVEDDASIQLGLRMSLEREGYRVEIAEDGATGLNKLRGRGYDLCILDIMLPKLNGYELLRTMEVEGIIIPVVVLSARTDEIHKVMGLDLGASDYMTKPFSLPELLARVRAALRRRVKVTDGRWHFGEVCIDPTTREVTRGGELVDLTVTEYNVLATLVHARGRPLSRKQIYDSVWGENHAGTLRTIDNFVGQLRNKLEENPAAPALLLTVRGVGYRLAKDEVPPNADQPGPDQPGGA